MADDTTNLEALLNKIATEQKYLKPDIKISPISTGGANYSSRLYLVEITSNGKHDHLFAKIAVTAEEVRKQVTIKPYDTERLVYAELVKIYRELEKQCDLPDCYKLGVPKYYGADATHLQEILVLEDLSSQGYTLQNRMESVSWQYAAAAVTELAKFHALSIAFQHNDPKEFDKVANKFPTGMFTEHEGNDMFYNSSVKSAMAAVREENKEKLQRFLDSTSLAKFCSMYGPLRRPVLIHADFRHLNMLHRTNKDGTLDVMVVDYQTVQAGCPVIDLIYFIFNATDGQFRAKHYQDLIDHYHAQLGSALARLGLDVEREYSRQDFEFELKEKLSFGLHMSVICLPVVLVDKHDAPELDSEFNMAKLAVQATGDYYAARINEVVDDYVAWGILV